MIILGGRKDVITSSVPVCYFPSTVIFLDEKSDFLSKFTLQLPQHFVYHFFNESADALQALQANQQSENLSQWCFTEPTQADQSNVQSTGHTMCLDLAAIHWEVYNPQRFCEYTVMVINTVASDLDKLALCRNIQNHAIKKILLVDASEKNLMEEAFQSGLVDLCLDKNDPNINLLLLDGIKHLQLQYFLEMSNTVSNMLITKLSNCLYDPVFIELFYRIQQQEKIIEYYLLEESGSFLMLDDQGKASCLFIKQQQDLLQHYQLAKTNNVPAELLEAMKAGKKIPSFGYANNNYSQSEWNDWANYIHDAQQLSGNETYYYTYLKNFWGMEIYADRILSYQDYVKQVNGVF